MQIYFVSSSLRVSMRKVLLQNMPMLNIYENFCWLSLLHNVENSRKVNFFSLKVFNRVSFVIAFVSVVIFAFNQIQFHSYIFGFFAFFLHFRKDKENNCKRDLLLASVIRFSFELARTLLLFSLWHTSELSKIYGNIFWGLVSYFKLSI